MADIIRDRGILYLCATPIGNLEDITLRVLRVLKEVALIAAEDTRHTRKLLSHYDIHTPLTSYHSYNREFKGEQIIRRILEGENVALVSDAGMPGISDPGAELVALAVQAGITVVPLPGASAGIAALVVSGLPTHKFAFEGFLSSQGKVRRKQLTELKREQRAMIFYESPRRLTDTLADMLAVLGDRPVAVARELTKTHEEIRRGGLAEIEAYYRANPPRGEICLVVAGSADDELAAPVDWWAELPVNDHVARLTAEGMDKKEAIKQVARLRGLPKRDVYEQVLADKEKRET